MGLAVEKDGDVQVVRVTGVMRKAELDTIQWSGAQMLPAGARVQVLVIVERFEGWHRGDDWGDVSFLMAHGDQIEKMAIVGEPQWEDKFLMFTGAGFRKTTIRFFPCANQPEARAWLAEQG